MTNDIYTKWLDICFNHALSNLYDLNFVYGVSTLKNNELKTKVKLEQRTLPKEAVYENMKLHLEPLRINLNDLPMLDLSPPPRHSGGK